MISIDPFSETWDNFANKEPYWSIITDNKYKNKNISNLDIQEFYNSGLEDWDDDLYYIYQKYNKNKHRVLDIGSGLGRISMHAAKVFDHITCVDISQIYLNKLKYIFNNYGIENYNLLHLNKFMNEVHKPYDFIYSILTLQHSPPDIIEYIVDKCCQILKQNGIAILHIPYWIENYHIPSTTTAIDMYYVEKEKIYNICSKRNIVVQEEMEANVDNGVHGCYYILQAISDDYKKNNMLKYKLKSNPIFNNHLNMIKKNK